MKTNIMFLTAALALTACSQSDVIEETKVQPTEDNKTAISFNTFRPNITRAGNPSNLETLGRYNFGLYSYFENLNADNTVKDNEEFMDNYLVGYSDGNTKGYDNTGSTTWAKTAGTVYDHKSPWFYDVLGKDQYSYTGTQGLYTAANNPDKMSANAEQMLHYWEKSYGQTSFYFYSPYCNNSGTDKVKFEYATKTFTLGGNAVQDSYDNGLNEDYAGKTSSTSEFYFGKKTISRNEYNKDVVNLEMSRLGARVLIAFYSDIPGYKVQILDLNGGGGTMKTGYDGYKAQGIQANPVGCVIDESGKVTSVNDSKASYNINADGGKIDISGENLVFTLSGTPGTTQDNLMFRIPGDATVTNVPGLTPANLTSETVNDKDYQFIPQKATESTQQKYSYSPTIYYPVPQSTNFVANNTAGFMFHVTFRIVNVNSGEYITVHNARVYVPPYYVKQNGTENEKVNLTMWQPNTQYTYIFKITDEASGTTDPEKPIDPDDPTPDNPDKPGNPDDPALHPIVLDNVEVTDFDNNVTEEFVVGQE